MEYWDSGTVPFGGIYGPAGGNGGGGASDAMVTPSLSSTMFGLEIPTLLALGFLTWWIIKKLD